MDYSNKLIQSKQLACVAQTVEQLPCKQRSEGATPSIGSKSYQQQQSQNNSKSYTPASCTQSGHISNLNSYNNCYITTKHRVIHKQSSGARLADIRPKWSDHNINAIGQAVKVGNKYPSTK